MVNGEKSITEKSNLHGITHSTTRLFGVKVTEGYLLREKQFIKLNEDPIFWSSSKRNPRSINNIRAASRWRWHIINNPTMLVIRSCMASDTRFYAHALLLSYACFSQLSPSPSMSHKRQIGLNKHIEVVPNVTCRCYIWTNLALQNATSFWLEQIGLRRAYSMYYSRHTRLSTAYSPTKFAALG